MNEITYPDRITSGVGAFSQSPRWLSTARPPYPQPGLFGYATDLEALEWWNGNAWQTLAASGGPLYAQGFGTAKWDGTEDVGPSIQAAIDYAETLPNGATIYLPAGDFPMGTELRISKDNVSLMAWGQGGLIRTTYFPNTPRYGTILNWTGVAGGTMLTVSPPTNMVNGVAIGGNNVKGILFDCNEVADTGVLFASVWHSLIDIAVNGPEGHGVIMTGAQINGSSAFQQNDVWLQVTNRNGTGACVYWDARDTETGVGNVSLNRFHSIRVQHNDGDGLVSANSDNNLISMLVTQNITGTGTGDGVVFRGAIDAAGIGTKGNVIEFYSSAVSTFIIEGTGGPYLVPSTGTIIQHLDVENSTPEPVLGTDATGVWRRGDNVWSAGVAYLSSVFATNQTAVGYGRALTDLDPVKVVSGGNNGLLFSRRLGGQDFKSHFYTDSLGGLFWRTIVNTGSFNIGSTNAPLIANDRLKTAGTAPTVTGGGTSPSAVTGNSTAGTMTLGTAGPTSVTLTFNGAGFDVAPVCVASLSVAGVPVAVAPTAVSTSAVTFTFAAPATSGVLTYLCIEPT